MAAAAACAPLSRAREGKFERPLPPEDALGHWIGLIGPAARRLASAPDLSGADYAETLARESVEQSLANLRGNPRLAALEQTRALRLHGAFFDIDDARLLALDEARGRSSRSRRAPPLPRWLRQPRLSKLLIKRILFLASGQFRADFRGEDAYICRKCFLQCGFRASGEPKRRARGEQSVRRGCRLNSTFASAAGRRSAAKARQYWRKARLFAGFAAPRGNRAPAPPGFGRAL